MNIFISRSVRLAAVRAVPAFKKQSGFLSAQYVNNIRWNSTNVTADTNKKDNNIDGAADDADGKNATQPNKDGKPTMDLKKFDSDEYDDWEPKTAKEKVSYYSQIAFTLGLLGLGAACVYVFIKEVNPFGRSPQSIFDQAADKLMYMDEIIAFTGPSPKAYGRDHGTQTEGRRNIVDSRTYKEKDGSNRTRIRFNLKGPKGRVLVWAEVSDKMPPHEYVYLICQDIRSKRILTIEDNRVRLEQEMELSTIGNNNPTTGDNEAKNALMKLLGGNSGGK